MFRRIFVQTSVPPEYRSNFLHLFFDIAWVGILSGSSVNFLSVYATRLGATGFQIGLLGSMGSVVSLLLAIPTGRWLERRATNKAVFWSSIAYRLFYFLWIPLPWILGKDAQVWALIVIALAMGIPVVPLSVGFNTLFAEAVPGEWRAYVAGIRNVLLAITFMISSLGSGYLLDHVSFPGGYQLLFAIGALSAMMSSLHLYFIKPVSAPALPAGQSAPAPARQVAAARDWRRALRLDIWRSPFGRVLFVLLLFHFTQYLPVPLFPLYNVNILKLTDAQIGLGTALFYLAFLFASTQLVRFSRKAGHHKVASYGMLALSFYPILLSFSHGVAPYLALQALGGNA